MRFSIAIVSFALFLLSCDSEAPTPPSTLSTSPPGSPVSSSPAAEPPSSDSESVAPVSGVAGTGDPSEGEALFNQPMIAGSPGCVVCHSLEPDVRMVGPSMADAATVATGAVQGLSAEDYLRQSIVEPNAHVTEGFMPDLMFQDYGDTLSGQQINDVVAFLMTQT